jgi:sn-glycerol 3-phosphate transport system permease protein
MVERKPFLTFLTHLFLIIGFLFTFIPIYLAFVAASHSNAMMLQAPTPFFPGRLFFHNFYMVLTQGLQSTGGVPVLLMLKNSLIMAMLIAFGKIIVSVLSAYAFVFFDFPFKKLAFMLIFSTLMLPVEVRIVPTFQVVASLSLLNHFAGLTLPLIASATATFLFRQFFMTIPRELVNAARLDGAGPIRFFWDILLPLSKTNIASLFIIMFIYGWNQYLWPLVATTKNDMTTIVMGIQHLASVADEIPEWNHIMAISICAMLPPLIVIIMMQRLFEKGLIEMEK